MMTKKLAAQCLIKAANILEESSFNSSNNEADVSDVVSLLKGNKHTFDNMIVYNIGDKFVKDFINSKTDKGLIAYVHIDKNNLSKMNKFNKLANDFITDINNKISNNFNLISDIDDDGLYIYII